MYYRTQKTTASPMTFGKALWGLFLLLCCFPALYGQYSLTGPSPLSQNDTRTYTLAGPGVTNTLWTVSNGATITLSSNTSVTVKFNNTGNTTISASILGADWNAYSASATVSVYGIPANPGNPTISSNNCGQTTLQRSGSPAGGITWYWQGKTSNGTSTTKGSGSTYVANEGNGTYYIRARHNTTLDWSTGSGSVSVTTANLSAGGITGAQTICYAGNPSTMSSTSSASNGSGGYTYQWQYSNNGSSGWTNIGGATGTSYNPPGGLTTSRWYRRRVSSCSGQLKYTNTIKVTVRANLSAGTINGATSICYRGNPGLLGNASSPSGGDGSFAYQWQISSNGSSGWTNISGATSNTYNPPGDQTQSQWFRRRVISCGQTKYSNTVTVTVHPLLVKPTGSETASRCGSGTLALTLTPGASANTLRWYTASTGGSHLYQGSTYTTPTLSSNTTYYASSYDTGSGCESTVRTAVAITITSGSTYYEDSDNDGFGNPSVSTNSCTPPANYVSNNSDHDDTTEHISDIAPQTYYKDTDGDGYGDANDTGYFSYSLQGYVSNSTDECPTTYGISNGCTYTPAAMSDENYVYVRNFQKAVGSSTDPALIKDDADVIEQITYFDGLGRPMQEVAIKASGSTPMSSLPEWTMDWTAGSGGTAFFNQNGSTSENEREMGLNPFGNSDLLWKCGNDTASNADGGWNTDYFNVDKTATYRYTVWVKRSYSNDGTTYHGTQNVNNLDGTANGNPYFWNGDLPQLNQWYLLVGVIHPYTYSGGDTGESGVYDMQGNKVLDGTEYTWRSDTTTSRFRSYLYYATNTNVRQFFWNPVLQQLDGTQANVGTLLMQQLPSDVVTQISYDDYGRQAKDFLPYSEPNGTIGAYRGDRTAATKQYYEAHYKGDYPTQSGANVNAFGEKEFEASPLNRVLKQAAPGEAWKLGSGHEIEFDYKTNTASEVRLFQVDFTNDDTALPTLSEEPAGYPAGVLYKTVTRDENHSSGTDHSTEEFTDKDGRVVLKRTYNSGAHDTYYVYDDYGNLSFVLPPKASENATITQAILDDLGYQYKYDHRNRLIEKKVAGKGWEYIVYNKLDQPIMTQDANLAAQNKWLFTKYDAFGRVAYTGLADVTATRAQAQTAADGTSAQFETPSGNFYTVNTYPSLAAFTHELHTVNQYDDYSFDLGGYVIPTTVLGQTVNQSVKGLPTGTGVRVLGSNPEKWVNSLTLYDNKRRPILVGTVNEYLGTTDIVESKLDFAGKVEKTKTTHTKGANAPIVTEEVFTYDPAGRVVQQTHSINDGTPELIASNSFDGTGQLVQKQVGNDANNSPLQMVDYSYNTRGWLTRINDVGNIGNDLFSFRLGYNEGSNPLYNGNIAKSEWKTANVDQSLKSYTYTYDALNRIKKAVDNTGNYNLHNVVYDKNGNITALDRKGQADLNATIFGFMDVLAYTYDAGNKLLKVSDNGPVYGFKDGTNSGNDYTYDANGNMISDANKGITSITYNHLNLPTQVTLGSGNIQYIYDATGVKQKKVVNETGLSSVTTEYAGNYIYEGSALQFFNHAEGYVEPNGSNWDYIYQYKDHLGNIRLAYHNSGAPSSPTLQIREENNYYPFGLKHKGYNGGQVGRDHKFEFQGQEIDNSLGYNMHEFELRHYDAAIGRFVTTDPYEQFVSPYVAMGNNPVVSFDPDGGNCLDANGNAVACPDGDIYDQYRGSDTNHINVLEGVTLTPADSNTSPDFRTDYDYSEETIPGKMQEDLDFIINGEFSLPRVAGVPSLPALDRFALVLIRDIEADPEAADDALTAVTAIVPLKIKGVATSSRALVKNAGLPIKGKIRFIPRPSDIKNGRLHKKDGGYVDKFGNIWKKPSGNIIGERHWDVQLSAKGKKQLGHLSNSGNHLNVSVDGRIVH
ncbi:DUF6443 domain-containing protein [Spongiimicrobium sp. 2-473A-2-J]|uniref:DUF6443 domain-containing protein n=1 Tax=Eudoraea algarum TaxID=3417568 RepID=UPI003D35A874